MYVDLHRHSEHSLPDGTGTAMQYAERAADQGKAALGLTEHATLSSVPQHIAACDKVGIMPIIGVEAYFREDRTIHSKENSEYYHMVLHCKNLHGWHNLMALTSEAFQSGFYSKPCIDWDLLKNHHKGLIATTACVLSYPGKHFMKGDVEKAEAHINQLQELFGDDLYMEIMPHDVEFQRGYNLFVANLANRMSIPMLATSDTHYVTQELHDTQDIVLMIRTNQSLESRVEKQEKDEEAKLFESTLNTLYLQSEEDMRRHFKENQPDLPKSVVDEAIKNTGLLAGTIIPFALDRSTKMPKVAKDRKEAENIVSKWAYEGLEKIGKIDDEEYRKRVEFELDVMREKRVFDYFILVGDLCRWIRSEGIRVNVRGSAAGCLVSYLIGITSIDPIAYGLLFERFLNPDRGGLPDIDIDVASNKRDKVKRYLRDKYGHKNVADVVAYTTFAPRAAVKDVARVLNIPYGEADAVVQRIDPKGDADLPGYAEHDPVIKKYAEKYPDAWRHSCNIQDQFCRYGKHAAGMIITEKAIVEYMPTQRSKTGGVVTAWSDKPSTDKDSKFALSDFGFNKVDILGLTGLQKQQYAVDLIEKVSGEHIDLDALPVARDPYAVEPDIMDFYSRGMTLGLFQFGGRDITNLVKQIKPDSVNDLAAANALFRPGPLEGGVAFEFPKRKHKEIEWSYWHDSVIPYLEETYGSIAYQEQVMQIAQVLGGFSAGDADAFRKAISKYYRLGKKAVADFMAKNGYDVKFIDNCTKIINKKAAQEIWRQLLAFGGYGFNKSHSASYAYQSYQDAWLKKHYPFAFYASLLTHDDDLISDGVREAKSLDVSVKLPDINDSDFGFTFSDAGLRYGLNAIKDVGDVAANHIVAVRKYGGRFSSFEDFTNRIEKKQCNSKVVTALIEAGAMDSWGMRDGWDENRIMAGERDRLGVSVSVSVNIDKYKDILDKRIYHDWEIDQMEPRSPVVVGGEIAVEPYTTKKNKEMAYITVYYGSDIWNVVVFPSQWEKMKDKIEGVSAGMIAGVKANKGNQIIFNKIESLETIARSINGS